MELEQMLNMEEMTMATRTQMAMRAKNTKSTVLSYMWALVLDGQHIDCGEVNHTLLAEDALRHFEPLGLDDGPEADVWDWAAQIAAKYDEREGA